MLLLPYQESLVLVLISACAAHCLGLISMTALELVFGHWEFDNFYKLGHESGAFLFSSE